MKEEMRQLRRIEQQQIEMGELRGIAARSPIYQHPTPRPEETPAPNGSAAPRPEVMWMITCFACIVIIVALAIVAILKG